MLFAEGEPGHDLFIMQSGLVKAEKVTNKGEVVLGFLRTGDIFGEMALLESRPRSYSAVALAESHIITLPLKSFDQIRHERPQLIATLTGQMARRIWLLYKQLDNTGYSDPVARLTNILLFQIQYNEVPFDVPHVCTLHFGIQELLNMAGVTQGMGDSALANLTRSTHVKVSENEIYISDTNEVYRRTEYFKKVQKMESSKAAP
jgi:CRP-like cAMP-binding protein